MNPNGTHGGVHGYDDDLAYPNGFADPPPLSKNYAMSGKIMLSAIVVLFTVVLLILCLHVYARWYLLRRARQRRLHRRRFVFTSDHNAHNPASNAAISGLDPDIVKTLPVFVYTAAATTADDGEPLECAVCLSEFQESEKGRILPKCRHSFHIACIDMWFYSHATCPLCRATVEPPPETLLPVSDPPHVAVDVSPEPSDLCDSCRRDVPCSSSSSSSSAAAAARGGGGIRIDVPPRRGAEVIRNLGEEVGSPGGGQGFKSPGGRMMSLKRILSIDLRFYRGGGGGGGTSSNEPVDLERGGGGGAEAEAEAEERTPRTPAAQR